MNEAAEREELAQIVYLSTYPDPTSTRIQPLDERAKWEQNSHRGAADAILTAGYRKPKVLGYVVVGRDGGIYAWTVHPNREFAQASADKVNADLRGAGIDWDCRVAEIVEAA